MSVDTYLKGKQTSGYRSYFRDGVKILLSPRLTEWAAEVDLDVGRRLGRRRFLVDLEHRHTVACQH